jgi:general secretion pathway protein M
MKLKPMRPVERRIAAIVLLLLTLLLAYLMLLHWWFVAPLQEISSEMSDLRDTQSRYAAAIAEKPQLQKRLATLGHDAADSSAFLPEQDANSAAAGLMQRVVDAVAAHTQDGACEVTQKMPVPNPPENHDDPYRKVAVSISLRCDMQPLAELLYALEHGTPYVFVNDFSVYRNPVIAAQHVAGASLEVQFTLSGYIRSAAPASGASAAAAPSAEDAP